MPNKFKINSLFILALAASFYFFFMSAKHDPALSAVNAFANDPYDAIGSFGIQAAAFIGILSLIRAFRPFHGKTPSEEQKVLLARTQILAVSAVTVTLVGNIVAMARYSALWIGLSEGYRLATLLGGLLLLVIAAGALAYRSVEGINLQAPPNLSIRAFLVFLATVIILAFYPENLSQSTLGGLFTVVMGAILLFAPMWALSVSLIPYQSKAEQQGTITILGWLNEYKYQVIFVILLGVLMGFFFVLGESTEEGAVPHLSGLAFVASVYIGLETSGLLIGYGFLKKPLGLFHRTLQS
jgi:flagellar basal body-associated protein FliL